MQKYGEVKMSQVGGVKFEKKPDGTVSYEYDTRKPTLWERWISPMVTGVKENAEVAVK